MKTYIIGLRSLHAIGQRATKDKPQNKITIYDLRMKTYIIGLRSLHAIGQRAKKNKAKSKRRHS
jgi:hypothetical protein